MPCKEKCHYISTLVLLFVYTNIDYCQVIIVSPEDDAPSIYKSRVNTELEVLLKRKNVIKETLCYPPTFTMLPIRSHLVKNTAGAHKGPSMKYKNNTRTLKSKLRAIPN